MPKIEFVSVVHPSAILSEDVKVSDGKVIMPSVTINTNSKLGRFCILSTKSSLGHDYIMKEFSSLASGITDGSNVIVGKCSCIYLGSSTCKNIDIGNNTVIGSDAFLVKSIGDL